MAALYFRFISLPTSVGYLFSGCQNWADLNQDINSNYVLFSISNEGISVTESLSGICDVLFTVEG